MTDTPIKISPEPERDRWGRYVLPMPTDRGKLGAKSGWQRATTLIKMASDTYHLDLWKQRSVAKGLASRPDLLALASTLDVSADSKRFNDLCEKALDAAGATSKATLGTALHSMTEAYDLTGSMDDIPVLYWPRIQQYIDCLRNNLIEVIPSLIEGITVSARYKTAGTFDRVVRLSDASLCMLDLKTGSSLDFGRAEIAAQLATYVDGVNAAGVWNGKGYTKLTTPVRTDFGLVAHLPSDGDGCVLYKVDLDRGRKLVELCCQVRDSRKDKSDPFERLNGNPVGPDPFSLDGEGAPVDWHERLAACWTRAELVQVAADARKAGQWTAELANRARAYVRAIEIMNATSLPSNGPGSY